MSYMVYVYGLYLLQVTTRDWSRLQADTSAPMSVKLSARGPARQKTETIGLWKIIFRKFVGKMEFAKRILHAT